MSQKDVISKVNQLVANQGVLFVKLHQYHWHVQGPHFFTLHEKLEELYNETSGRFDAFAERIISLGETPYSTLREYLDHTSIEEKTYDKKLTAEEMVGNLVNDYRTMKKITLEGIKAADEAEDPATEDMLTEYVEELDVTIWMLQAYLGNDAQ